MIISERRNFLLFLTVFVILFLIVREFAISKRESEINSSISNKLNIRFIDEFHAFELRNSKEEVLLIHSCENSCSDIEIKKVIEDYTSILNVKGLNREAK